MTNDERDRLLTEVHDAVVRIEERCKACRCDVSDLQTTLYDPQTGLRDRMVITETERKSFSRTGGVVLAAGIAIIGGAVTAGLERLFGLLK